MKKGNYIQKNNMELKVELRVEKEYLRSYLVTHIIKKIEKQHLIFGSVLQFFGQL